ncbi:MAG: GNAT family N-acetyltransferase [Paludibacteraceae bacterium]|nr:GNAT family N-acetyltransferase [Paludibacteraceae bacterium]
MQLLTQTKIDRTEWSRLVASSATGTWFQTPEAFDFFNAQKELFKPFAIAIEKSESRVESRESRELRGVCVGYVTVEKSAFKQFLTRRAIIIGGPCWANDATNEEVSLLLSTLRQQLSTGANAPIYIESRNFNDYSRWKDAFAATGFDYKPHLNFHVDTSSVEVVETNLGKSRKRDIRTTIREGVTITSIYDLGLQIDDFERERMVREYYQVLKNLYKTKVKTPLFPESFFQALAKHPDARFLLAELNGKIIGGTVCVAQEGKCLYEWFACGEDGVYPHVFPSCYATYAGIRYAAEHNMPRFDMMGAGKPDEAYGVRDFKAKFGGQEVEHGRWLCITKPILYKIGTLGVKLLKKLK